MNTISRKAYAKLNLVLDITGRREDGYHLIRTVMHTIDIADELVFTKTERDGNRLFLGEGSIVTAGQLSVGEDNLILKAANRMKERFGLSQAVDIHWTKKVPMAAGMASGSADAACTLLAINELFDCHATKEELEQMALLLGADVPYCLFGGCALAEGIGEVLTPLPALPHVPVVIAKPQGGVSTADIYRRLDAFRNPLHPPVDLMTEAIRQGDVAALCNATGNILEAVCREDVPVIGDIEIALEEAGAMTARMTGSGPTVFGIFEKEEQAAEAASRLQNRFTDLFVTATVLANLQA